MISSISSRRGFLRLMGGTLAASSLSISTGNAADVIGKVVALDGQVMALRGKSEMIMQINQGVVVKDVVVTGAKSSVALLFGDQTKIQLGERSELLIDEFLLGTQGAFDLSKGALVFDRPEDAPRTPVAINSVFGQLGVRGTRFFAGPSNGVFGVFVERGRLDVSAAGEQRVLEAGDGVNIAAPGAAPSAVAQWSTSRINAAFASVGL